MSSARAKADQRPLGAYYTPDALARRLVGLLPILPAARVWEPHVGGGAFARALTATTRLMVSDIDPKAPGLMTAFSRSFVADFLDHGRPHDQVDWIIGNPPFTGFEAHLDMALNHAPNVAFLLRLAAMETAARVPAWKRWPLKTCWVLAERPSFTGGGTDSCAYGWFWFCDRWPHGAEIHPGWSWRTP